MLWGHILPVQKRNSPKNVKRARNTFNLIKNVSAAFNLNLKSLLELKLETQITVQWISLKTNISMVAGESPEWKCYIRKKLCNFPSRSDDCWLRLAAEPSANSKTIIFETTLLLTFPFSERRGIFENAFHSHIASQWWKVDAPASLCFDADSDFHTRKGSRHRLRANTELKFRIENVAERKAFATELSASFQCFGGRGLRVTKKNSLTNTKKQTFYFPSLFHAHQHSVVGNYSNLENHFTRLHSCDEHESIEVVTMKFNHDFEFYRRLDYYRHQNFEIVSVDECSSCSKR